MAIKRCFFRNRISFKWKNKNKLNCVIIKNINEDEIIEIAELAQKYPIDVRFIELMPMDMGKSFLLCLMK